MTTFKFNFSNVGDAPQKKQIEEENIQWLDSEEIKAESRVNTIDEIVKHAKMFTCGDIEIGHVVVSDALANIDKQGLSNFVKVAEDSHSDLVTGKYEGGLKIWECTRDLVEYLEDNKVTVQWDGSRVLDLGCGVGILGILAFMNNSTVAFQDYNKEVIENVTIPNVLLNIEEENRNKEIPRCKFFSGDWASFDKILSDNERFDYILTSETIYNPENYTKLINILSHRLSEVGTAFVAAKTYYFGVGGGTKQFQASLEKLGCFHTNVCWKSNGGIQREILKITKKL